MNLTTGYLIGNMMPSPSLAPKCEADVIAHTPADPVVLLVVSLAFVVIYIYALCNFWRAIREK